MDTLQIPKHGGARAGSGPKPRGYTPTDFDQARARNEAAKASMNELKLEVERGRLVPRDAVRQASATALAMVTQSLRSIPDNVERTLSLDPAVVEAIALQVDATLTDLAKAFGAMAEGK
jgi:phage terminase Nu1 subunit (DNA packaging protein)